MLQRLRRFLGWVATCYVLLLLIVAWNPMQLLFLAELRITNTMERVVFVTPVGIVDPQGTRTVLPGRVSSWCGLPVLAMKDLPIEPGLTRRFVYDWDDAQFSEIVVTDRRQTSLLQVDNSGLQGIGKSFYGPQQVDFRIERIPKVGLPPPVAHAWERTAKRTTAYERLFVASMLAVGLVYVVRMLFRRRPEPAAEAGSASTT